MMGYEHTQRGLWYVLLFAVASGWFVASWSLRHEPLGHYICLGVSLLMIILGLSFMQLTLRDEQDALAVRFGPLPIFFTRIPYDKIQSFEPDRTTLLDGWGIHYFPGRGTTYNIWGFHCVRIELENRTIRVGTDDVENLMQFLRQQKSTLGSGDRAAFIRGGEHQSG
jgi:hypothetical protein